MNTEKTEIETWAPFRVRGAGSRTPSSRSIRSSQGIGDRLRAVAFAERQARDAFRWAADRFADAPDELRRAWRALAVAEDRHMGWLLDRMEQLGIDLREREVSDHLWRNLTSATTAEEFARAMADAEDRGRQAGERFQAEMAEVDPTTAALFGRIAAEEREHVALAGRFFPCPRASDG